MIGAFNRAALPDWPTYAGTIGLTLVGKGQWRTTKCELHGGSDSLRVKVQSGGWICMNCQAHGGDTLSHYMQRTGADFKEAALALGAWDKTKVKHTERAPRTLGAHDAMEVIVAHLLTVVLVISNARQGVTPSDADWLSFLSSVGSIEALVMEYRT